VGVAVHPIPTTPGLVSPWVGLDQPVGISVGTSTVQRLFLKRTDKAGTVTAQIRNATGVTLSVTLGPTVDAAAATGSVAFADAEPILLRVTASDAGSQNLGGSVEIESSLISISYLSTLARVKLFLGIPTGTTTHDALLLQLLYGISTAMESTMKRRLVATTYVGEVHEVHAGGFISNIVLHQNPVSAVSAVTENGVVVVSGVGFRLLDDRMLQRITGSPVSRIWWAEGFVAASYTAGYALMPEDLALAATAETAQAFKQSASGGDRLGKSGDVFGGQTDAQFLSWTFLPVTRRVLAAYARR
jgi:hypothetical protein